MKTGRKDIARLVAASVIGMLLLTAACSQGGEDELSAAKEPAIPLSRPAWLSEEPLIVVGNWDTAHIFRRRKGGNPVWHEEDYIREHSEEAVEKLSELGVTMAIIHYYKGFGLEAEKKQLEDARKLAALCKKHGLRVGVYVGSTVGHETFLLEKPEAKEWFVPDYLGAPVRYGGTQTFRKRVYFMHPGFIDYMKQVIRIAVNELQADLIHFDNTSLRARRPTFHHPLAKRAFKDFLLSKYSPEEREARFGFHDVTYVEPPLYEEPLATIDDPLFQEWTDFRCQQLADFYDEMGQFIRGLNPDVAVENNPHSGLSGINTVWEQGVDYPRLLRHTDVVWTEEGNEAGVSDDGRLISKIRTYKQAVSLKNKVFTYTSDSLLQMAEAMTFNRQCLGMVGGLLAGYELSEKREGFGYDNPYTWGGDESGFQLTERKRNYIDFYRNNFQYYRDVETVADVAVLRNFATMAFNNGRPYQSTYLFEQALIEAKVPFDIVFDHQLEALSKYRVLVLADQEALSDEQLDIIRSFVRKGGGLVATEHTSLYTEWRQRRRDFGLKDLFQVEPPLWQARGRRPDSLLGGETKRNEVGSGRVVYVPEVVAEIEKPLTEPMTSKYWRLPKNWPELIAAVKWVARSTLTIETRANRTIVMEVAIQGQQERLLLHMVNYDVAKRPRIGKIDVSLRLPGRRSPQKVEVLSPDRQNVEVIRYRLSGDGAGNQRVHFTSPRLETYNLVVVHLK